jgi:hypothetical protein
MYEYLLIINIKQIFELTIYSEVMKVAQNSGSIGSKTHKSGASTTASVHVKLGILTFKALAKEGTCQNGLSQGSFI